MNSSHKSRVGARKARQWACTRFTSVVCDFKSRGVDYFSSFPDFLSLLHFLLLATHVPVIQWYYISSCHWYNRFLTASNSTTCQPSTTRTRTLAPSTSRRQRWQSGGRRWRPKSVVVAKGRQFTSSRWTKTLDLPSPLFLVLWAVSSQVSVYENAEFTAEYDTAELSVQWNICRVVDDCSSWNLSPAQRLPSVWFFKVGQSSSCCWINDDVLVMTTT